MKDFKYYVIFGISLVLCIYVVAFMPSVQLLEDHSHELWFSEAETWTEFYVDGVQGFETVQEQYKGDISFDELKMQLDISIGKLQELQSTYANEVNIYEENKASFYENFGITNYIEYDMLCNAMAQVFENSNTNKVLTVNFVDGTVKQNDLGISFEVMVTYTSGLRQKLAVTFYNKEQEPLKGVDSTNVFPTILRILPKVEG